MSSSAGNAGGAGGGVSREEAAWRDLVARFDLPASPLAEAPWPAREHLPAPPPLPGPDAATAPLRPAEPPAPKPPGPGHAGPAGPDHTGPRHAAPAAPDHAGPPRAFPAPPGHARPGHAGPDHSGQAGLAGSPPAGPAQPGRPQPPRWDWPGSGQSDAARVVRPAGDPRSYTPPPDDADERYVPTPLPPPARLDSVSKLALAGVIGGPAYLLIVSLFLHWDISPTAAFIAVAAFIGGFVTLVVKLGDRPRRDDDDDGAVL